MTKRPSKHYRIIASFGAALIFLLICMNTVLFTKESRRLHTKLITEGKMEISLLADILTEPMLAQQYNVVEKIVRQWGEKRPEILVIKLLSSAGYLLAHFDRDFQHEAPNITSQQSVTYMGSHLVDLTISKTPAVINLQSHA